MDGEVGEGDVGDVIVIVGVGMLETYLRRRDTGMRVAQEQPAVATRGCTGCSSLNPHLERSGQELAVIWLGAIGRAVPSGRVRFAVLPAQACHLADEIKHHLLPVGPPNGSTTSGAALARSRSWHPPGPPEAVETTVWCPSPTALG